MWRRFGLCSCIAVLVVALSAAAADTKVSITKKDCTRLVRHEAGSDVAYQPGQDHRGRQVAPADLPGSGAAAMPNLIPEVMEIPLSIKPMAGAGYATNDLGASQMALGTVKYDIAKGVFTLNGQPLGSSEQQELAERCQRAGAR